MLKDVIHGAAGSQATLSADVDVQPRRFLFVLRESGGAIQAELELARRLIARGHAVHVLGDPCMAADAQAIGCLFSSYVRAPYRIDRSPASDFVRAWEPGNPLKAFTRQRDRVAFGPALAYAEDLLDVLEGWSADVLVIDRTLFGAMLAAEKSGLPTAVLVSNCYLPPMPGRPAPGAGFLPARGLFGRLRDHFCSAVIKRLFATGLPTFNAARAQLGLAPLRHPLEQLDRADRILVMSSHTFDFMASTFPPNVRYVGPMLADPVWAQPWVSPWPADHPDPLVLVGFSSTFQNQHTMLQRLMDAIALLPVRALVTLGPAMHQEPFRTPPNVVIRDSAPHAVVLQETSVVLTHAGHGTVIRALAHGVPLVCLPMGNDQYDNAARVVASGAGLWLSTSVKPPALCKAIQRVLQEPNFRAAARRMAAAIAAETASPVAVRELEGLAVGVQASDRISYRS
jgi:UDP:flavonoid glycosyltransferase YjiC (YdhE family)